MNIGFGKSTTEYRYDHTFVFDFNVGTGLGGLAGWLTEYSAEGTFNKLIKGKYNKWKNINQNQKSGKLTLKCTWEKNTKKNFEKDNVISIDRTFVWVDNKGNTYKVRIFPKPDGELFEERDDNCIDNTKPCRMFSVDYRVKPKTLTVNFSMFEDVIEGKPPVVNHSEKATFKFENTTTYEYNRSIHTEQKYPITVVEGTGGGKRKTKRRRRNKKRHNKTAKRRRRL